jgi:hypothetical protein
VRERERGRQENKRGERERERSGRFDPTDRKEYCVPKQ